MDGTALIVLGFVFFIGGLIAIPAMGMMGWYGYVAAPFGLLVLFIGAMLQKDKRNR